MNLPEYSTPLTEDLAADTPSGVLPDILPDILDVVLDVEEIRGKNALTGDSGAGSLQAGHDALARGNGPLSPYTAPPPSPDYPELLAAALEDIGALAGDKWNERGEHDPGLTLLELLCYSLGRMLARYAAPLPKLLAAGSGRPVWQALSGDSQDPCGRKQHVFTPEAAPLPPAEVFLDAAPVTADDYRLRLLRSSSIVAAWVRPIPDHDQAWPALVELSPTVSPEDARAVLAGLNARLETLRCLGQPAPVAEALRPVPLGIRGRVDLTDGADATAALTDIIAAIEEWLRPQAPMRGGDWPRGDADSGEAERIVLSLPFVRAASGIRLERLEPSAGRADSATPDVGEQAGPRLRDTRQGFTLRESSLEFSNGPADASSAFHFAARRRAAFSLVSHRNATPRQQFSLEPFLNKTGPICRVQVRYAWQGLNRLAPRGRIAHSPLCQCLPGPGGRGQSPHMAQMASTKLKLPASRATQPDHESLHNLFPALYGLGEAAAPSADEPERLASARQMQAWVILCEQFLADLVPPLAKAGQWLPGYVTGPDMMAGYIACCPALPRLAGSVRRYRERLSAHGNGQRFATFRRGLTRHAAARLGHPVGPGPDPAGAAALPDLDVQWLHALPYQDRSRFSALPGPCVHPGLGLPGGNALEERLAFLLARHSAVPLRDPRTAMILSSEKNPHSGRSEYRFYLTGDTGAPLWAGAGMHRSRARAEHAAVLALQACADETRYRTSSGPPYVLFVTNGIGAILAESTATADSPAMLGDMLADSLRIAARHTLPWVRALEGDLLHGAEGRFRLHLLLPKGDLDPAHIPAVERECAVHVPAHLLPAFHWLGRREERAFRRVLAGGASPDYAALRDMLRALPGNGL